tara:strand:- start:60 stop:260 length:201 start_codon:yes stop_codon:yes gene_type:complete
MIITRISPFTGNTHTMNLPITQEQIGDYQQGTLLQDAFPQLSPDEREFFKTGITPEEWDKFFGENA